MLRSDIPNNVPDAGFARQNNDDNDQDHSEFSDTDGDQNESLPILERYRYLIKYIKTNTIQ